MQTCRLPQRGAHHFDDGDAMIHYHGSPLSGPRDLASRFYSGKHAMVSFAYPEQTPIIAEVCQSFALDNGAFTTWTKGKEFDFNGYCEWVDQWITHPGFDWCLIPDTIDGDESANDRLLERFMGRYGLSAPIVPVWHFHESVRRLQGLCGAFRRVALGSSGQWPTPGTDEWWYRVGEFMPTICLGGRPVCKLHGLRMLSKDIFPKMPLASADSTNAVVNAGAMARFGTYPAATAAERAHSIASGIEAFNSAAVWYREETMKSLFS